MSTVPGEMLLTPSRSGARTVESDSITEKVMQDHHNDCIHNNNMNDYLFDL